MSVSKSVLKLLSDGKPRTIHEIASELNRPYSSFIRSVVVKLNDDGYIEKHKRYGAGRPAFVYRWRKPEGMSLENQYKRAMLAGYPYSYKVWLEEQLLSRQSDKSVGA